MHIFAISFQIAHHKHSIELWRGTVCKKLKSSGAKKKHTHGASIQPKYGMNDDNISAVSRAYAAETIAVDLLWHLRLAFHLTNFRLLVWRGGAKRRLTENPTCGDHTSTMQKWFFLFTAASTLFWRTPAKKNPPKNPERVSLLKPRAAST